MQYDQPVVTKLTMRSDFSTSCSSRQHGANLNTYGFNMDFIAERNPMLALELMRLWRQASALNMDDPKAHEEDCRVAEDGMWRLGDLK
jgi:hypothetical protein